MCGGTRACGCFSICCLRADVEGDCSANAMLDNRECERCDTTEDVREDAAEPTLPTRNALLLERKESLAAMLLAL
jgi:hypothetical protein